MNKIISVLISCVLTFSLCISFFTPRLAYAVTTNDGVDCVVEQFMFNCNSSNGCYYWNSSAYTPWCWFLMYNDYLNQYVL